MNTIISSTYNNSEFLEFIKNLNPKTGEYTLAHNPVIPKLLQRIFGYSPCYIRYVDDETGELIGFMNGVTFNGKFISMPHFSYGGVACKNSNIATEIEQNIKGHFEIRSFHHSSKYSSDKKVTAYLDLSGGEDSIFPLLKYNIRRQIRIATENNITVKRGKKELLDDFLKVYYQNMTRLGSPPQPRHFFSTLLDGWENGEATIFCSYYRNKPVGGCFLLSFGDIIENCWAGTLYEYNKIFVPYLVYSEIIKYSIREGYRIFSFGRSSKEGGTLGFKKHWKPEIIQLYFNYSSPLKENLKDNQSLRFLYRKTVPLWVNIWIGKLLTKYIY